MVIVKGTKKEGGDEIEDKKGRWLVNEWVDR